MKTSRSRNPNAQHTDGLFSSRSRPSARLASLRGCCSSTNNKLAHGVRFECLRGGEDEEEEEEEAEEAE